VLGNVQPGNWSGGVGISVDRAREAIATLAAKLDVSVERAAQALIATADATMARALRRVSVDRGIDPRDVTLVAFGGGGPLHACGLADMLGIERIVVPPYAGVLSALGLALAPDRRESVSGFIARVSTLSADALSAALLEQESRLRAHDNAMARWWLRMRYEGQGHELDIPVSPGDDGRAISERFVEHHRSRTGFVLQREPECISIRTAVIGDAWPVNFERMPRDNYDRSSIDTKPDILSKKAANNPSQREPFSVTHFDDGMTLDETVRGEATVRLTDATMHIGAGWIARSLPIGGWMLERE
jgi:N-methylhydantoinase A